MNLDETTFIKIMEELEQDNFMERHKGSEFAIEDDVLVSYMGYEEVVVIPEGVKVIAGAAFSHEERITEVTIPDTVKEIHIAAFMGCKELNCVYLPKSLERVSITAFLDCDKLKHVYYAGTPKQWSELHLHGMIKNDCIIHFNHKY